MVQRMAQARKDRECVDLARKMGVTFAKAQSISRSNVRGKAVRSTPLIKIRIEPLLQLEVKVAEGREEKCVVYEGQAADEVARNFAQRFSLSAEARDKIRDALKSELNRPTA